MNRRVTQSDVARYAGVHNTTVSLALRDSPLIPAPTRARIHEAARSLGYQPDPTLRALANYRKTLRGQHRPETLLYVTAARSGPEPCDLLIDSECRAAAEDRATELGFRFRVATLGEAGMHPRRLARRLVHEEIRCVLFGPDPVPWEAMVTLDWSRLCCVRLGGNTRTGPGISQVALDASAIVSLALERLRRAGRHRIALVVAGRFEDLDDETWSAAFVAEQYRLGDRHPPAVLRLSPDRAHEAAALPRWLREGRFDAVLGLGPSVPDLLARAGLRVPADVAYADLFLQDAFDFTAGVRPHCARLGELGVELLAAQLERNQFGLSPVRVLTTVGGCWRNGASLPQASIRALDALPLPVPALSGNLVA